MPFKWYPKEEILAHAAAWRLLDLSESNGVPIDLVIATKFPSYFVRHPNKVAWLMHQYRAAYELCGTPYSDFDHADLDVGVRQHADRARHPDARGVPGPATRSPASTRRLERFNGLHAEPLYHPPRLADRLHPGPSQDYLLVGRPAGDRQAHRPGDPGDGAPGPVSAWSSRATARSARTSRRLVEELGVADRVHFAGRGRATTNSLALYAGALGVVFAPFDEDYGYVTLEAFLARKPVVTAQGLRRHARVRAARR